VTDDWATDHLGDRHMGNIGTCTKDKWVTDIWATRQRDAITIFVK